MKRILSPSWTCQHDEMPETGEKSLCLPHQGSDASRTRHHVAAALEQDDGALEEAAFAVDEAAIVVAAVDGHVKDETGPSLSHGCKRREPQDDQERVEDQDGHDMVGRPAGRHLFRHDKVGDCEKGDEGLAREEVSVGATRAQAGIFPRHAGLFSRH